MNGTQDINVDAQTQTLTECMKSVNEFGKTTYQNICTNTTQVVPWGAQDWFGQILLMIFLVGIVALVLVSVGLVIKTIADL